MTDQPIPIQNETGPLTESETSRIREGVIAALQTVFDPEIPVNIHELGLIYGLEVSTGGVVVVEMTLTSPACPVAGSLPGEVEAKLLQVPGVTAAQVELVWDPPWSMDRMSEAAKLELGFF
jgi:FeS assembly SUF system protein